MRNNNEALATLANDTVTRAKARVTAVLWDGKTVWIKKPVPPKATSWHKLQQLCAALIPLPILRPTVSHGGTAGLETEARRIARFRDAGIPVPEIHGLSDRWIILGDMGQTIESLLKKDAALTPERLRARIENAALTLAELHTKGIAHGRGKLNDLVRLPDGRTGVIDFEEDIENAKIPLPALMARDVFLFTISVARFARIDAQICAYALAAYKSHHNDPAIFTELRKLLRLLAPFYALAKPFHAKLKGEPRQVFDAVSSLRAAI